MPSLLTGVFGGQEDTPCLSRAGGSSFPSHMTQTQHTCSVAAAPATKVLSQQTNASLLPVPPFPGRNICGCSSVCHSQPLIPAVPWGPGTGHWSQVLSWAQGSDRGQAPATVGTKGAPPRAMPTLLGTHRSLRCPGRRREFCLGTGTAHRGSWGGHPIPSVSCLQALWGHIVLLRPCRDTLGVSCVPQECGGTLGLPGAPQSHAGCPMPLGCPHSPAALHIWDGDTDGSPCTPQEGPDTCTLLWAGATEPPVIYFYTLYYSCCFYSFVPFVLCLVELHVPALPAAAQGPLGAA